MLKVKYRTIHRNTDIGIVRKEKGILGEENDILVSENDNYFKIKFEYFQTKGVHSCIISPYIKYKYISI
jgi:hypothetical protein